MTDPAPAMIARDGLAIAESLVRFLENEVLPGTGIEAAALWRGIAAIYARFAPPKCGIAGQARRSPGADR